MEIGVATSNRADYGILVPLLRRLEEDEETNLRLLVTGTHLSAVYGYTVEEIESDGFPITARIPILEQGNSIRDVSVTIANALSGFAAWFADNSLDLLIVLGDRTEMLGVCTAAMMAHIPIGHISGGEITLGAVDDSVRHAITKMSRIHFVTTEIYRKRVIQMGAQPESVYNVGSLSAENILHEELVEKEALLKNLGIVTEKPLVVVTFHPVTRETGDEGGQLEALIEAMEKRPEYFYLITKSNSDVGGRAINERMKLLVDRMGAGGAALVDSLGRTRYLSAVKASVFVLGNSSSGITEAPILGTPTVNIGNRQQGRLRAETIIDCRPECTAILHAMDKVKEIERCGTSLYGDGETSSQMLRIVKSLYYAKRLNSIEPFYDIEFSIG